MVGMTDLCPRLLPPGYRGAGVLLHVTSLPSRHGIGDLGPSAFTFVDCLREAGQEWWQGLPVGPTGWSDSPYQSLSSFAGNGLLISPDLLVEEELLGESDVEGPPFPALAVDYERVVPFKQRLLDAAWRRFVGGARPDLRVPQVRTDCRDLRDRRDRWGHRDRRGITGRRCSAAMRAV